jgi:hypothetical protein
LSITNGQHINNIDQNEYAFGGGGEGVLSIFENALDPLLHFVSNEKKWQQKVMG